jgi:hypothetical protein
MESLSVTAFICFAALLSACAPKVHTAIVRIDPAFEVHVDRFMSASIVNNGPREITDLIIEFRPLSEHIALCQTDSGETSIISIDPKSWVSLNPIEQQLVIYHELGHCLLRRLHRENWAHTASGKTIPDSVMSPCLIPFKTFSEDEEYFEWELFQIRDEY